MANEPNDDTSEIVLSMQDLREVTRYAAECAQEVLEIFERTHPADSRPRDAVDAAVDAAWTFARGGNGRRGDPGVGG
jgi:Imm-5 like putative immunity protein